MVARALRNYVACLVALWAIAFAWAALTHQQLSLGADIRFSDFTIFDARFRLWNHANTAFFDAPGFLFEYPAPILATFLAFWRFTPNACLFYLVTVAVFAVCATAWLGYQDHRLRLTLAVTLLGSFPLFFLLDRANIEGAVWIVSVLGITALWHRHWKLAAVLLGLAAAMKLFPGMLLFLFLAQRRYWYFALSLVSGAVFTVVSLAIAGPSPAIVLGRLALGLDYFRQNVILQYFSPLAGFEHSAFSLLKQVLHLFLRGPQLHSALEILYVPYLLIAVSSCLALYWTRIRHLPRLNQLFALTILSVTLPFISFDYTLVHLYIPFVAFLFALSAQRVILALAQARLILLSCAVIFAPLTWMHVGAVGFGAQVKTVALLILLRTVLNIPLQVHEFGAILPLRVSERIPETVS